MAQDTVLREHLAELLEGGHAHASFEDVMAGVAPVEAGMRPPGPLHSMWELLEHMRIAQNDILRFSTSADYVSPAWPSGYWPPSPAPPSAEAWESSVRGFQNDLAEFLALVRDPANDLYKKFPWGNGQTLLREALLIADHNSHHLGQLILVRKLLGLWK